MRRGALVAGLLLVLGLAGRAQVPSPPGAPVISPGVMPAPAVAPAAAPAGRPSAAPASAAAGRLASSPSGAASAPSGPSRASPTYVAARAARAALPTADAPWVDLASDGLHDPLNPGLASLQQPAEALAALPRDTAGNLVRWVQALDSGAIAPRSQVLPGTEVRLREDDIIVSKFRSMPAVKFPHRQHTLWLDCANCHDKLFKPVAGANRFSMVAILNGEQCGLCHGAVSFPLTECNRCHSVPNASLQRGAVLPAVSPAAALPAAAAAAASAAARAAP